MHPHGNGHGGESSLRRNGEIPPHMNGGEILPEYYYHIPCSWSLNHLGSLGFSENIMAESIDNFNNINIVV